MPPSQVFLIRNAKVLLELTAEELKELGVEQVGHRRKILAAIVALRECVAKLCRNVCGDTRLEMPARVLAAVTARLS